MDEIASRSRAEKNADKSGELKSVRCQHRSGAGAGLLKACNPESASSARNGLSQTSAEGTGKRRSSAASVVKDSVKIPNPERNTRLARNRDPIGTPYMQKSTENQCETEDEPNKESESLMLLSASSQEKRLTPDDVRNWSEERCRAELHSTLTDAAACLWRAALILKIMIERKMDISALPRAWVRQMLKIAEGDMLPEVMRDFDGLARTVVARMPIKVQRLLCENPAIEVVTESGDVKLEKIQNLHAKELHLALDFRGPRTIQEQRELLTANDEKPDVTYRPAAPGTFDEAMEFFDDSKRKFGHLKELSSLYAMISVLKQRTKRRG